MREIEIKNNSCHKLVKESGKEEKGPARSQITETKKRERGSMSFCFSAESSQLTGY